MNKKMLYCPKCQAMYEDGSQRFCTNEGARLLPYATSEKNDPTSKGVFSNILNKSSLKKEGSAKVSETSKTINSISAFQPPNKSKFFNTDESEEIAENSDPIVNEIEEQVEETEKTKPFEHLPLAGIINPIQMPEKQIDSDKIFTKETKHIEKSSFEPDQEDILEPFDLETSDTIESTSATSDSLEDIELNLENKPDVSQISNNEIALDLGLDDIPETEPQTNSQRSFETFDFENQDSEIELDLFESENITKELSAAPKFDLELDEIEDVSVPEIIPSNNLELDLQSKKEVNLADSIPRIELDLADLDEISVPIEINENLIDDSMDDSLRSADLLEIKSESEAEKEKVTKESFDAPIVFDDLKTEEKVETSEIDKSEEITESKTLVENEEAKTATAVGQGENEKVKATEDSSWEKHSSDSSGNKESKWFLYPLIGIIVLGFGLLGYFYLTQNDSVNDTPVNSSQTNQNQSNLNINTSTNTSSTNSNENLSNSEISSENLSNSEISSYSQSYSSFQTNPKTGSGNPPSSRQIKQPPNIILYKNERKNQRGELSKNFLGFSIYYPKDWKESRADNKFLDISKKNPQGLPIKQLLISRYDSKGTFEADKAIFDDLVKQSNNDLRKILSNYQVISKGESTFQNGRWQVYEVDFQGIGSDKKLILWGKRLWIPVGMKNGFIITMIGTSLSDDVKSVNDLGENDDLAEILKTFEPELNK